MSKGESWSPRAYETKSREVVKSGRSVTHEAEIRSQSGLGLDISVDPKNHGATRESVDVLTKQPDGSYLLTHGIAIPFQTSGDLTGSMGHNVDEFFRMLPRIQKLLVGSGSLLGRYDVHFSTGGIQDEGDSNPFMITEFERDNLIENQMSKVVPERKGGDPTEEYQLALFYAGERIKSTIWRYGLKGYFFIVGDEIGRDTLKPKLAKRVFGLDVQEISVEDLAKQVLDKWHVFYLQIGTIGWTTKYWSNLLGSERVVNLPTIEMMAEIQACIVGLTEGVLELQNLEEYLITKAGVSKHAARLIVDVVSGIPTRAQCDLPNFNNIPLAGTSVANPEDLYPDTAHIAETPMKNVSDEIFLNL